MRVVEVVPIVKGIAKSTLTYFTKDNLRLGSFASIPLRNGSATGVVIGNREARLAKTELRKSSFALKKLRVKSSLEPIDQGLIEAVNKTANHYATTPGAVFASVIGKTLLENLDFLPKAGHKKNTIGSTSKNDTRLIQLEPEERLREYRAIARECFARNTSIMIVVPTENDAKNIFEHLRPGIEKYVFNLSNQTSRELKKSLTNLIKERHPVLVVTTPSLVTLDRKDLSTIIIEKENSRAYRSLRRPFVNARVFLEAYATAKGLTLILGDSILSIESLWKEREGIYPEFAPLSWRLKSETEVELVDMKENRNFEVLSERVLKAIKFMQSEKKLTYIFAVRKGLASTTICGDCSTLLSCKNCGAPLVLHSPEEKQQKSGTYYKCHHCGAERSAETRCDNCGSWKLLPLGIGVERVAEFVKEHFPDAPLFILDKDHTPTSAKAKRVIEAFKKSGNGILVGTEQAQFYLESVPLVVAASVDSLFSIPDFFINERIFYLITSLKELASEKFILQTRASHKEILEFAVAGNVLDFFRKEVAEREELHYPPFSLFIKAETGGDSAQYQEIFAEWRPHFIGNSMVLRLPRASWPDESLRHKLLLLPQQFLIKVDTENIF